MDRFPLVPVVSRADFGKLEGVISEHDVLERYRDFGEGLGGPAAWSRRAWRLDR